MKNMSKFRAFYNPSSGSDRYKKEIGVFSTAEEAARELYATAKSHGDLYDCDPWDDVEDALLGRGFYMIGYGPKEISIEEVVEA